MDAPEVSPLSKTVFKIGVNQTKIRLYSTTLCILLINIKTSQDHSFHYKHVCSVHPNSDTRSYALPHSASQTFDSRATCCGHATKNHCCHSCSLLHLQSHQARQRRKKGCACILARTPRTYTRTVSRHVEIQPRLILHTETSLSLPRIHRHASTIISLSLSRACTLHLSFSLSLLSAVYILLHTHTCFFFSLQHASIGFVVHDTYKEREREKRETLEVG